MSQVDRLHFFSSLIWVILFFLIWYAFIVAWYFPLYYKALRGRYIIENFLWKNIRSNQYFIKIIPLFFNLFSLKWLKLFLIWNLVWNFKTICVDFINENGGWNYNDSKFNTGGRAAAFFYMQRCISPFIYKNEKWKDVYLNKVKHEFSKRNDDTIIFSKQLSLTSTISNKSKRHLNGYKKFKKITGISRRALIKERNKRELNLKEMKKKTIDMLQGHRMISLRLKEKREQQEKEKQKQEELNKNKMRFRPFKFSATSRIQFK